MLNLFLHFLLYYYQMHYYLQLQLLHRGVSGRIHRNSSCRGICGKGYACANIAIVSAISSISPNRVIYCQLITGYSSAGEGVDEVICAIFCYGRGANS